MSLIYLLETSSIFFIASIFILGLLVGSFLNVVIHRLPLMMQREWAQHSGTQLSRSERPLQGMQSANFQTLSAD